MDTLKKLQKLSLIKRKIIFCIVVSIVGFALLLLFIFITANRLRNIQVNNLKEEFDFPSFEIEKSFTPSLFEKPADASLDIGGEQEEEKQGSGAEGEDI